MNELIVFGYVAIVVAAFVALWAAWHILAEIKDELIEEYRRSRAFSDWRNKRDKIGGME